LSYYHWSLFVFLSYYHWSLFVFLSYYHSSLFVCSYIDKMSIFLGFCFWWLFLFFNLKDVILCNTKKDLSTKNYVMYFRLNKR
jgi:hypothetical protein